MHLSILLIYFPSQSLPNITVIMMLPSPRFDMGVAKGMYQVTLVSFFTFFAHELSLQLIFLIEL